MIGVAAVSLASACSSSGDGGNAESDDSADALAVSVYLSHSSVDWPFNVAKELGYFSDNGLDVTINGFDSGATASTAFRSAHGTFLQAGDLPSVSAVAQGGLTWIANTNNIPKGILLITKSDVTEASQLKGKKIGAGLQSSAGYFISKYLTDNGMSESDVKLVNLSLTDGPAALIGGSVDAIVSYPSFATTLLAKSNGKYHIAAAGITANFTMVDTAFAKDHPDAVVGLLKALDKAGKYIRSNTDEAAKIEAKADSITPETAKSWIDAQFGYVNDQPTFPAEDYKILNRIAKWAIDNKLIDEMPDICGSVDLSFLKEAAPSDDIASSCPTTTD